MKSLPRVFCGRSAALASLALCACASPADHFYTLNTVGEVVRAGAAPTLHVRLDVTVPSMVDRAEMVLNTGPNAILVLDHERWASALPDEVANTLARDIEARRADVIIADRSFDQAASPPVLVKVDIIGMSVRRGERARVEAHWRVVDSGRGADRLGGGVFEAPVEGRDYAAVAEAYSLTVAGLADRLAADLRPQ